MKRNLVLLTVAFALCFVQGLRAQNLTTTDVPRILSYQGHITNADQVVTGVHPITIRLYSDPEGKHKLWEDTYATEVKDGIFSVLLGSQTALPSTERLNKPIWLGVSVAGTDELRPLTQFTTAPYALNVPDKSITMGKLSDDVLSTLMTSNGPQDKQASPNWTIASDPYGCSGEVLGTSNPGGCDLILVTYGSQVMRYKYNATSNNILGGYSGNTLGSGGGNIIAGGGESGQINAIGANATTDYAVISGGFGNDLDGGGSFIGGGEDNSLVGEHSVVVGGTNNAVGNTGNAAFLSAILGGSDNTITGDESSILGGINLTLTGDNTVGYDGGTTKSFSGNQAMYLNDVDLLIDNGDNSARKLIFFEPNSSGTGGSANLTSFKAQSQTADINYTLPSALGTVNQVLSLTAVAGTNGTLGWVNDAGALCWKMTGNASTAPPTNFLGTTDNNDFEIHIFDGDAANKGSKRVMKFAKNSTSANITGGYQSNLISGGVGSIICGGGENGAVNEIQDDFGVIVGGKGNRILSVSTHRNTFGVIVGGSANSIILDPDNDEELLPFPVLVGGHNNQVSEMAAFLGGGEDNKVLEEFSALVGGENNEVKSERSFIGGGNTNVIDKQNSTSVICGGHDNHAVGGSFPTPDNNFIGGGNNNQTSALDAVVVGGEFNIASGILSFIGGGGGFLNGNLASGSADVVVGGAKNSASNTASFVGGGQSNTASNDGSAVVGGQNNTSSGALSFIGAGGGFVEFTPTGNTAAGAASAIPAGVGLIANGTAQTVLGHFNKPLGNPLLGLTQLVGDDRLFIIGNGASAAAQTNAYEVSENGHSIVFHNNTVNTAPAIKGARYIDNTPIAWGRVAANGTMLSGFGATATRVALGKYRIDLNYVDPYNSPVTQVPLINGSSVVATIEADSEDDYVCRILNTTPVNWTGIVNQFFVRTMVLSGGVGCSAEDGGFFFVVFARP